MQVNNALKNTIKIPRAQLDKLSEDDAKSLAFNDPIVKELLDQGSLNDIHYKLHPAYEANINFFIRTKKNEKIAVESS